MIRVEPGLARLGRRLGRRLRTVHHHRRSLRVRLLAALLGIFLVVLAAFDIVTLTAIRAYLLKRMDDSLAIANRIAQNRVQEGKPGIRLQSSLTPGRYYAGVAEQDGTVRPLLIDQITRDNPPRLPHDLAAVSATPRTAAAVSGGSGYRIIVTGMPGSATTYLIVGISLDEYHASTRRITADLIAGTAAAFLVLAAAGWALTRRGLRPLERIADKADTVTGGDLSTRMDATEATTEVGRLSTALNSMLDRIETSVRERDAAQARIRQFMADASHELRTPLTTVRAYAELYEQGALSDPAAVSEAAHRISGEAARMSELVGQLLTLSRFDEQPAAQRCRLDLAALVQEAAADARAVEPERRIAVRIAGGPAWIDGDGSQLRMMLGNLLTNVRVHAGADAAVTIALEPHGAGYLLDVADTGPGVPASALPQLFDRFYRATPATQRSSGLGLAIVAAVVESHGGTVRAELAQPAGLRIITELPRTRS